MPKLLTECLQYIFLSSCLISLPTSYPLTFTCRVHVLKCAFLKVWWVCDFRWHKLALTRLFSSDLSWALAASISNASASLIKIYGHQWRKWVSVRVSYFPSPASIQNFKLRAMLHPLRRLTCFISKKDVNSHGWGGDEKIKLSTTPECI